MEELKKQIIAAINNSKLPAEGVYYIVKDVYRDVEDSYYNYLKEKEAKAAQEAAAQNAEEEVDG